MNPLLFNIIQAYISIEASISSPGFDFAYSNSYWHFQGNRREEEETEVFVGVGQVFFSLLNFIF